MDDIILFQNFVTFQNSFEDPHSLEGFNFFIFIQELSESSSVKELHHNMAVIPDD